MSVETGGAVYRIFDEEGSLLYVGSTNDARRRLAQHRNAESNTPASKALSARYHSATVEFFQTLSEARLAEARAIDSEGPEINQARPVIKDSAADGSWWSVLVDVAAERGMSLCEVAYSSDMTMPQLQKRFVSGDLTLSHLYSVAMAMGVKTSELARRFEVAA